MSSNLIVLFAGLALTATSRHAEQLDARTPFSAATLTVGSNNNRSAEIRPLDSNCVFANGSTTCTSVDQYTYTTLRSLVSGCLYGPNALPGRRTRTFEDTYQVTVTTTTVSHGKSGPVYDTTSSSIETLISSRQISDVCEPI